MTTWRRWQKITVVTIALTVGAAGTGLGVKSRAEAHRLVTNPRETRSLPRETPGDRGMPFEEVAVRTPDGLRLVGWFIPAPGGALVMTVHGYKDNRGSMLGVAEILHRHGFAVLDLTVRAHDQSDGDVISFGVREMADLDAWFRYATSRPDVDISRIGLFGVSMGGALAIQYSSRTPGIRALVADGAFSSIADTVETSVTFFTGLPPFPFAPMILFWMERENRRRFKDDRREALDRPDQPEARVPAPGRRRRGRLARERHPVVRRGRAPQGVVVRPRARPRAVPEEAAGGVRTARDRLL